MRIIMMGTGPFAVPSFEAICQSDQHEVVALYTRPVKAVRRSKQPPNPMKDAAERLGIEPILAPESINDAATIEQLKSFDADLFVVCDFGQILSKAALSASKLGGINLHGSLLPKYRGAAPVNWAVYDGCKVSGVTVIHMTPKLDGGPCLTTAEIPIGESETTPELEERLSMLGPETVLQSIEMLENWDGESVLGEIQDQSLATKAPRLSKEMARINWSHSAVQIYNQIRAFKPWPNSFTTFKKANGEEVRLIIDWARVAAANDENGVDASASNADVNADVNAESKLGQDEAGQVVLLTKNAMGIQTGDGVLNIEQVQPAGKRVMKIAEYLNGAPIQLGDICS